VIPYVITDFGLPTIIRLKRMDMYRDGVLFRHGIDAGRFIQASQEKMLRRSKHGITINVYIDSIVSLVVPKKISTK